MDRPRRPVANAAQVQVDGGLWQARCDCRWHSHRVYHESTAASLATMHNLYCGHCLTYGREAMGYCSCMNCQRRRDFKNHQTLREGTA